MLKLMDAPMDEAGGRQHQHYVTQDAGFRGGQA
jgi:hypothetical protein